jgi:hypothetical protein
MRFEWCKIRGVAVVFGGVGIVLVKVRIFFFCVFFSRAMVAKPVASVGVGDERVAVAGW